MAIDRTTNKIHITTTGVASTSQLKVVYILFTPGATGDTLVLRETATGADCVTIKGSTANNTMIFRFAEAPLLFTNGLYVQTITSGAKAVVVTSMAGS